MNDTDTVSNHPTRLTARQRRFVEEYTRDFNATEAYKRAGYTARTDGSAASSASTLLRVPKVAEAVRVAQAATAERCKLRADQVIEELKAVAFSDIGDVLDFTGPTLRVRRPDEISEPARRALQSVKVKRRVERDVETGRPVEVELVEFRLWDKLSALDKLGRHLNLFQERPALEALLLLLPVEIAGPLREAIARHLEARKDGTS